MCIELMTEFRNVSTVSTSFDSIKTCKSVVQKLQTELKDKIDKKKHKS